MGTRRVAGGGCQDKGNLEAGQANVAFRHALVRDAVLESLLPHERSGLHRRAAEALDALSGDDPDCLEDRAQHREGAGDKAAAAELLVVAARRNQDRHASASAEVLLRRALDLFPGGATADAAREALVEALGALGRWQEALGLDHELLRSGRRRSGW